ncbi:hypothetical protein B0A49_05030 [Cryomyces minteri]|uniref:Spt20-like SEP domain-containing protein n=1 Tax=Cryomyces minteri TaxID=331657 RepID=A0A4U0X5A5_9PEZI|nr:hypothetical protein B0A49_05030 [Cryomyces minteri]
MATAVATRPSPALRQRRESQRPSLTKSNGRAGPGDGANDNKAQKGKLSEPLVRTSEHILQKFKGKPPSLIVHLYPTHFRFDQQDGNFGYKSPMAVFLEYCRKETVPHDMLEELFQSNVTFYDGCLIVQIYDHKTSAGTAASQHPATNAVGAGLTQPSSIHNYNEHLTPSPYVPYPVKSNSLAQAKTSPLMDQKEKDRENMPAPSQLGSARRKSTSGSKITHIVLHSTPLSLHNEISILASTPASDSRINKRHQNMPSNGKDGATPSTPLTVSVPPTPTLSRGSIAKRPKMILEEKDVHVFEAEVLISAETPLYLEPARDFGHAQAILDALRHPLHENKPPPPKTRKRTTAELAAEDARDAEEERFMLLMDERLGSSTSAAAAGVGSSTAEGQGGAAAFEPRFSRFKTLENIRMRHEESVRVKKEEDARLALEKRQLDAEMAKRKAEAEQQRRKMQRGQEQLMQQQAMMAATQQQQQQQQQHNQTQAHALQATQFFPDPRINDPRHQSFSMQAQLSSPVVQQQTSLMNTSPLAQSTMTANTTDGVPHVTTSSAHGAGSPLQRPSSAAPLMRGGPSAQGQAQLAMVRQQSQQQSQSRHGTPQMAQGTPNMGQAIPATRHMTPTPRLAHGSPVPGLQGTPQNIMMGTPQMNQQQFTPQQMAIIRQQQARLHAQQQAQGMQGSPQQNMTPEQAQQFAIIQAQRMQAAQHQAQQLAAQQQQQQQTNPAVYQAQIARQMQHQMASVQQAQQQQQQNTQGSPPNPSATPTPQLPAQSLPNQTANGTMGTNISQMDPQQQQQMVLQQQRQNQLRAQAARLQQQQTQQQIALLTAQNGGQLPPHIQQQLMMQRQRQAQAQAQAQAAMQGNAGAGGGAGAMINGLAGAQGGGNGGGGGGDAQREAYVAAMRQQQVRLQMMAQMGRGQGGQGGQQQGGQQAQMNMLAMQQALQNGQSVQMPNGMPNGMNSGGQGRGGG